MEVIVIAAIGNDGYRNGGYRNGGYDSVAMFFLNDPARQTVTYSRLRSR